MKILQNLIWLMLCHHKIKDSYTHINIKKNSAFKPITMREPKRTKTYYLNQGLNSLVEF